MEGPASPAGLRAIAANRRFALWLGSQFSSNLGYSAWVLSILWLAYQISGTLLLSALVLFVQWGIYALTFFAGPFVDRAHDKRTVFLIVFALQAGLAALVGVAVARSALSVGLLLGAVAAMALLDDFWWTCGNTVPRLLVGKENLLRANGLQSSVVGIGSLGGYAAGAVLLVEAGPQGGAILRSAMLIVAGLLLVPVRISSTPGPARAFFRDLVDGWSIVVREAGRRLLKLGGLFAGAGFFLGAPALLITLFAHRDYGGSRDAYGLLFTSFMVGSIASGLVVGRANPRRRLGQALASSLVATGAALALAVAALPHLVASVGVWFLVGLAAGVPPTLYYAYVQAVAPPDAVGRVISDLELFPSAAGAFGAITLGVLAAVLAPATLGYTVGLGLVAVGLAVLAVPSVRGMRF